MKIGIIGAGISGLAAAYELTKKGYQVTVFEQEETLGGLAGWIKLEEGYIERFYHHIFESDSYILQLAKELGLAQKLKFYQAKTGIFYQGKIYPFSSVMDVLQFKPLSYFERLRCGVILGFLKFFPLLISSLDKIPASVWVKKYAGAKIYETIFSPLLEGKFLKYKDQVPTLWLWGRMRDRSFKLGYFEGSLKILFEALRDFIEKKGNKIFLGTCVSAIKPEKKIKIVIRADNRDFEFNKVIITCVSPPVGELLKDKLPEDDQRLLKSIDHLGVVCLILELKHQIQSQYWLNICDKKAPFLIAIEHTNMLDKNWYGGKTIFYLANYVHRNDSYFKISDDNLIGQAITFLKTLNEKFDESWLDKTYIFRAPFVQTIFKVGALKNLLPMETSLPNLYMINIDQMYPHDRNLNQSVKFAKLLTEAISNK